jgi:hypothetical protein
MGRKNKSIMFNSINEQTPKKNKGERKEQTALESTRKNKNKTAKSQESENTSHE